MLDVRFGAAIVADKYSTWLAHTPVRSGCIANVLFVCFNRIAPHTLHLWHVAELQPNGSTTSVASTCITTAAMFFPPMSCPHRIAATSPPTNLSSMKTHIAIFSGHSLASSIAAASTSTTTATATQTCRAMMTTFCGHNGCHMGNLRRGGGSLCATALLLDELNQLKSDQPPCAGRRARQCHSLQGPVSLQIQYLKKGGCFVWLPMEDVRAQGTQGGVCQGGVF